MLNIMRRHSLASRAGRLAFLSLIVVANACANDELQLDDLHVTSMELMAPTDQDVPADARSINTKGKGVLKIGLATSADLGKLAKEYSLNLAVDVDFCSGSRDQTLALSYIYDHTGTPLLPGFESRTAATLSASTTAFAYVAVAAPARATVDGAKPQVDYDLENRPDDLCLRVRSGRMFGQQFHTNVVRIQAQDIENLLAQRRR